MPHLTQAQLDFFETNGYLVVENVLDDSDLQPLWHEYTHRLNDVAEILYTRGQISETYANLPFAERYVAIINEHPDVFNWLEIGLPLENESVSAEFTPHHGPAVFDLLTNAKLLDVVESVLGPEVSSNPVQHCRLKPSADAVPREQTDNSYIGRTFWHQDLTGLLDEANETQVLTTWIAITDAPVDRGCLVVVPGSHRKGMVTPHCPGKEHKTENYIPAKLLGDENGVNQPVTLPVKKGSAILFNRLTEHSAVANKSGLLRWSFDLRWHPTGQPSGRPAFPQFIARSRSNPADELRDPAIWQALWAKAKQNILDGVYEGDIYNQARLHAFANLQVCA